MVAGYVRLSKDDHKKDYVSIENQKLILTEYAKEIGLTIDRWYEDDGISGYTFDRPGFLKLMSDLDKDIDMILAKDLSRIGRHNARVLLFLEEMKEMGKRVILTDDSYDSLSEEDDILGIKTWYNERYVKDTSRKIRRAMRVRQKEGTLAVNVPMGYVRNPKDKTKLIIDEKAASIIQRIFELYLEGNGFRVIAEKLSAEGLPTASILEKSRRDAEGKYYEKKLALRWSPKMVGDIIKNDIYIGNMRYHKNERASIHGRSIKTNEEEHYVFIEHHPAIIEREIFNRAQELLKSRINTSYRGNTNKSKYCGLLYCKCCGGRMTAITGRGKQRYYICQVYNSKGKSFCDCPARITETMLDRIINCYRSLYLQYYKQEVQLVFNNILKQSIDNNNMCRHKLEEDLRKEKDKLKQLLKMKLEIYPGPEEDSKGLKLQKELFHELENEVKSKINQLLDQLQFFQKEYMEDEKDRIDLSDILEQLRNSNVVRKEVEELVNRITVSRQGAVVLHLRDKVDFILDSEVANLYM